MAVQIVGDAGENSREASPTARDTGAISLAARSMQMAGWADAAGLVNIPTAFGDVRRTAEVLEVFEASQP